MHMNSVVVRVPRRCESSFAGARLASRSQKCQLRTRQLRAWNVSIASTVIVLGSPRSCRRLQSRSIRSAARACSTLFVAVARVQDTESKIVELHPSVGNHNQNEAQLQQERLAELMQTLENPMDRKVFELQMSGERRTEEFAKVMGISHLSPAEQRREVKRTKDRIGVHLKRKKGPRA